MPLSTDQRIVRALALLRDGNITLAIQELERETDIYDQFRAIREHPAFVFGTIFTSEDFPDGHVPPDFPARRAEDVIAERGNEFIDDYPLSGPNDRQENG